MQIDWISDIHLDFWVSPKLNDAKQRKAIKRFVETLFHERGEVLFIAGDTGHYNNQNELLLRLLSERYAQIFVTWGNHDLYLVSNSMLKKYGDSSNRLNAFKRICDTLPNVTFLDGETVTYEGKRIWGSGLWYGVEDMRHWRSVMSDASRIVMNDGYRFVDFDDYGKRCLYRFDPNAFYKREIEKLRNLKDADIVMTHVPPMLPDTIGKSWERYYRFEGKAHLERIRPKLWLFGHLHRRYDFTYGSTRLLCNPLGYPDERKEPFQLQSLEI